MKNIKIFDAHCDTAYLIEEKGESLYKNDHHTSLEKGLKYGGYCQTYAIFALNDFENKYDSILKYMNGQFEKYGDKVALCRNTDEIDAAIKAGKAAAILSAEGGELFGCDENKLKRAKADGISSVNITWNYENALSGTNVEAPDKGLTSKGKSFVKKCFENKIAVDVSHISDPGFWDIYELSKQAGVPFYASHSNLRSVCSHTRNLTDDQFKAIVECGGVSGINMYSSFVGNENNLEAVMRHIEKFLDLGGEKSIALGGDFDGCEETPEGIDGLESMYKLYDEILRNYGTALADDIFFNNLYNFYKRVL